MIGQGPSRDAVRRLRYSESHNAEKASCAVWSLMRLPWPGRWPCGSRNEPERAVSVRTSSNPHFPRHWCRTRFRGSFPTYLLPQSHNLEALEVAQLLSPGLLVQLLCVGAVVPLLIDSRRSPLLLQGTSFGAVRELVDDNAGEREGRERGGVAWDGEFGLLRGTLDEHL